MSCWYQNRERSGWSAHTTLTRPLALVRTVYETVRAYLRLDPNLADRKRDYPDGAFRAFVECLTFAEQQPHRGRFRNEKLLRVLLDKRGRWVPYLISHGDLLHSGTGEVLYLDGWDEWQEGDVTVPDRMRRLRNRKAGVTPTVTTPVTVEGVTVPSGGGGKPLAVAEAEAATRNNGSPPTFMGWRPKDPEGGAGLWNGKGTHDGRHGQGCGVCFPLIHSEEEVMP